ncbi:hypothetical protein [Pseudobacillus badius]|uniref:hypothetical protein n=1 Tax=Bacillus badius TaxID=1455 RepID=UPI0007B36C80|nr:hypothetical protein [Bacillus badius]KZR57991.1 hypothetical protein A3781_18680 [Bacillus badius]
MSNPVRKETHLERRKFIDYIHGLIRHEIHQGEDNPYRLQVLSQIHYDLLYTENLELAEGWKRKTKGTDELTMALERLNEVTLELEKIKKQSAEIEEEVTL